MTGRLPHFEEFFYKRRTVKVEVIKLSKMVGDPLQFRRKLGKIIGAAILDRGNA